MGRLGAGFFLVSAVYMIAEKAAATIPESSGGGSP
jgi:hypothetical protein